MTTPDAKYGLGGSNASSFKERLQKLGFDRRLGFICLLTGLFFDMTGFSFLHLASFVSLFIGVLLCY
jgi:hypothetical protein